MSNKDIDFGGVLKDVHVPEDHAIQVDVLSSSLDPIFVTTSGGTTVYTFEIDYTSIAGSGGAFYQLVASTSQALVKIIPYDTTGVAIGLYTGAAASEVIAVRMGPGYDVATDLIVPAGTRLSLRGLAVAAPTAGKFYIQLIG